MNLRVPTNRKIQSLDSIRDCFSLMVLLGEEVTREKVYNKFEYNCYAKHVCEQATEMLMAELKLLGNRG